MEETHVQRNYKDTVFRMLFRKKENLLSLYNALNKTAYTDVEGLEVTTLENAVYMNYKNDISFIFDYELMLYEHQSTVNPNVPLRDLIYVTKVLQGRIKDESLYGKTLVRLPTPRFVVFYNGTESGIDGGMSTAGKIRKVYREDQNIFENYAIFGGCRESS